MMTAARQNDNKNNLAIGLEIYRKVKYQCQTGQGLWHYQHFQSVKKIRKNYSFKKW